MLQLKPVIINRFIRHRLMTVVFLGVITSALSLLALLRLMTTFTAQRRDRAHDYVALEAGRLAAEPQPDRAWPRAPVTSVIGMYGGYAPERGQVHFAAPASWHDTIARAVERSARGGTRASETASIGDGVVVAAAQPGVAGQVAWAAYLVKQPSYWVTWRWIVVALGLATFLLVVSAVHAVVTVRANAGALNRALSGLALDLRTPVPRPGLQEFSAIADGVAQLAQNLVRAHEAEERLGRELAQQERLVALGRVVAGVAHEVRNPLASIKLRLDLAVSTTPTLPAAVQEAVGHASAEIARLDRLVADLLLVAGRSMGARHATPLGPLVQSRVDVLAPWALQRGVNVQVVGDAMADVDADSLARACDNLLRNAVEATPANGTVRVDLGIGPDIVTLAVEDEGAGVAPARVGELFEPFFTTKGDGTGLGLAISRAIARAHGGDVTYERVGATTRFTLHLPRPTGIRTAA